MTFSIDGMEDTIIKLNSAIEAGDTEALYELLTLSDRLYGKEIQGISDSFEDAKMYAGTLERNAKVILSILEDYVKTHSSICFSPIESGDAELNKLIQSSSRLYNNNELSLATEKIWDAYERLKSYYSEMDKKKSTQKIIDEMSSANPAFKKMYEYEFYELTELGNDFRIRHHEVNKVNITDNRQYDYFFKRCLSLISLAVSYLKEKSV